MGISDGQTKADVGSGARGGVAGVATEYQRQLDAEKSASNEEMFERAMRQQSVSNTTERVTSLEHVIAVRRVQVHSLSSFRDRLERLRDRLFGAVPEMAVEKAEGSSAGGLLTDMQLLDTETEQLNAQIRVLLDALEDAI